MEQFSSKLRTSGFDRQLWRKPGPVTTLSIYLRPCLSQYNISIECVCHLSYTPSSPYGSPVLIHPLNPRFYIVLSSFQNLQYIQLILFKIKLAESVRPQSFFSVRNPFPPSMATDSTVCEGGFTKTSILAYCISHTKYVTDHTHCLAGFTYGNNPELVCGTFSFKVRAILTRKPNVSGCNMDFSNPEK